MKGVSNFRHVFRLTTVLLWGVLAVACSRPEQPVMAPGASTATPPASNTESKPEELPWYVNHYQTKATSKVWQLEADMVNPVFGMYEFTQYPDKQPTPEQQRQADELVAKTLQAVKARGWLDREKGMQDGFHNMYKDQIHYVNRDFLYDDELLNPEKPEFLMYYPVDDGYLLMGVMFAADGHGPQIGGPLTLWHYHIEQDICYEKGLLPVGQLNEKGQCVEGLTRKKSPEMLHLWFFDHPEGRFATRMRLTPEQFEKAREQVSKLYEM